MTPFPAPDDQDAGPSVEAILKFFYVSATAEAVIVLDASGLIRGWSGGSEEILGYTADEVIGKPLDQIFTPGDRRKKIDRFEVDVASLDDFAEDDRWHVRKDGSRVWVTGTLTAVRTQAGQIAGFVKIMRDRTDLRTQSEFIQNENAALKSQNDRFQHLLDTVGHELRNPLGPLHMSTELLLAREPTANVLQAAQVIKRQIAVLKGLAEDLMDVTRARHAVLTLQRERIDLRDLLDNAVADMQHGAGLKGVTLVPLMQQTPIWVDADARRLLQVFLNLIGNALKYTPAGGTVYIKSVEEVHEAVVRVEDTGIGIAPDILPHIFEFFTQAPDAKKLAPGGLGVGLGLVREIVTLHQGTVAARSPGLGKGSEFSVRLPLAGEGGDADVSR